MNRAVPTKTKFFHSHQAIISMSVVTIYWIYCFFWAPPILMNGILSLGWLGKIIFLILSCHFTMVVISIYLHRNQTHMAVEYNPALRYIFRSWLWLTTGIRRNEWVAIHRAHHQAPDGLTDPHSPLNLGLFNMFRAGAEIYNQAKDPKIITKYGHVDDNDFLEPLFQSKYGPFTFLLLNIILFGLWGVVMWCLQMSFQIITQTALINGVGHYWGYRNFKTKDNSHNLTRWGILIAGEELHNNHHQSPASARFSYKKNEFDIGWFYIKLLKKLKLARLRKE